VEQAHVNVCETKQNPRIEIKVDYIPAGRWTPPRALNPDIRTGFSAASGAL
jgi:hypothetical protein